MLSKTKGRKFPIELLDHDEVIRLLSTCSGRAPTKIRNACLIILLWRAGCRVSEALSLLPKDLDERASTLNIRKGKGRKQRIIGLDPQAFASISRWMDARRQLGISDRVPLICSLKSTPILGSYVRELLPRLATAAGISKRVNPHSLRHLHATELLTEQVPINMISRQLGHSSIAVTAHYLDKVNPKQLLDTMRARTW
jgi:site-specific recombinase XerD